MKNELDCEVVQDLISNYIEELTCEHTNKLMKFHLEECDKCKRIYELLNEHNDKSTLLDNNINDAKKLKWYMKKVKLVNLFLGIIISIFTMYFGYMIYQQLFIINNYEIKSEDIEIAELYKLDNNIIYFTLKPRDEYFIEAAEFNNYNTGEISSSICFSRTIIPKRYGYDNNSKTFIVNVENGNVKSYDESDYLYVSKKNKEESLKLLIDNLKGENEGSNQGMKNIYYMGKNKDDKLLIWEEGMELQLYKN